MRYHNITKDDMLNGDGLRVVLWLSGCSHHCEGCQNPTTWNSEEGIIFDLSAEEEIFKQLEKEYISGITFSGGDPLHKHNLDEVLSLIQKITKQYPEKSIWLYTGYTWENIFSCPQITLDYVDINKIKRKEILKLCHVVVDGRFEQNKKDVLYHWAGSTNQRVIDVQATIKTGNMVLYEQV